MGAEFIAMALGGQRAGDGWMAHCPAHDDRTPSLSIHDADNGAVLVHCHAGCGQELVIARLRALGLWPTHVPWPATDLNRRAPPGAPRRSDAALQIWQAATAAGGTLVEVYLRARGIVIPVPAALRFHPTLKHSSGELWPAMVALVTRRSEPQAVHRTFLSYDGTNKAPVEPQKMMLGPCRSGAVRLADGDGPLLVGEGIETCLSAMQATGYPAWAALSASGLRGLELPASAVDIIILADGDAAGETAARASAARWARERRRVRVARPPRGKDFNDLLVGAR